MELATTMGIVFATLLLGPIFAIFTYLLFKKDEGEDYNAFQLIVLKVQMLFTFNKAKKEALKDELWVKTRRAEILLENYEAVEDLGIDYNENDQITHVLELKKQQEKEAKLASRTKELKTSTTTLKTKEVKKTPVKKTTTSKTRETKATVAKKTTSKTKEVKKTPVKKTTTSKTRETKATAARKTTK